MPTLAEQAAGVGRAVRSGRQPQRRSREPHQFRSYSPYVTGLRVLGGETRLLGTLPQPAESQGREQGSVQSLPRTPQPSTGARSPRLPGRTGRRWCHAGSSWRRRVGCSRPHRNDHGGGGHERPTRQGLHIHPYTVLHTNAHAHPPSLSHTHAHTSQVDQQWSLFFLRDVLEAYDQDASLDTFALLDSVARAVDADHSLKGMRLAVLQALALHVHHETRVGGCGGGHVHTHAHTHTQWHAGNVKKVSLHCHSFFFSPQPSFVILVANTNPPISPYRSTHLSLSCI